MQIPSFNIARLPKILFGAGEIRKLPKLIDEFGQQILLITGAHSFSQTPQWAQLLTGLDQHGISWRQVMIDGEPSPTLIDQAVQAHYGQGVEVVVGIGGGSVLDAAKAIAGLLPFGNSVMDHLEGVGRGVPYTGPALPFIAAPTTAGTGSEATKNAVLSQRGEGGYKKSFRHDTLVPAVAVVDPDLLQSCPADLLAANGMDAFTQLLESYVSTRANPFTDALALSGLEAFRDGFFPAWEQNDPEAARSGRAQLAYASLLSGINLAQTGLGSVHGLAAPLGAFFPCPHGVVCGTLVAEATALNIQALQMRLPDSPALQKYAVAGRLLADDSSLSEATALQSLVETLRAWTQRLNLPRLSAYGMKAIDIPRVVANSRGSSMQTNPLLIEDEELADLLRSRL